MSPREDVFVDVPLAEPNNNPNKNEETSNSNCRSCDAYTKRIRKKIHTAYFEFGCFIQKHYVVIFGLCSIALILLCAGVKDMKIDSDIEKMWIQSGGRLQKELKYTEEKLGTNKRNELQVFIQVKKNKGDNILNQRNLLEHKEMLKKAMELKVTVGHVDWGLEDFCVRYNPPLFDSDRFVLKNIQHLTPCIIMTPLDCFWEGAYIASPTEIETQQSWLRNSPTELLTDMLKINERYKETYKRFKAFFAKAGISSGYMHKPCLNPDDPNCPTKNKNRSVNIGAELTGGCYGLAANYMHWTEDLLVSGITKNTSGFITSAKALQSVIQIQSAYNFFSSTNLNKKTYNYDYSVKKAGAIIHKWKIAFTKLVNEEGQKENLRSRMMAFTDTSFQRLVAQYSKIEKQNVIIGFVLMTVYAVFTLKRWSTSVYSYGFLGLSAVVIAHVAVTAGLGLSCFIGIKFTSASTQVLPFLALGLGIDNMFLLVRTYIYICDSGKVNDDQIIGMCLGECGLSITVTAFTNIIAFLMSSIIPIITLQHFSQQAAMVVAIIWFAAMFMFSSVLSFDVERQKSKKYDLCCCLGEDMEENDESANKYSKENIEMNFLGNTNLMEEVHARRIITKVPNTADIFTVQDALQNDRNSNDREVNKFKLERPSRQFNVKPQLQEVEREEEKQDTASVCRRFLKQISLTYFAQNYFGKWLTSVQFKIIVLFVCCIQLFMAGYGTTKVTKGLNIVEMIPKSIPPYYFMLARHEYFSYYQIYIVTQYEKDGKAFDYANNQKLMVEFYNRMAKVDHVIKSYKRNKKEPQFWLIIYRNWLKDIQKAFNKDWKSKTVTHDCMKHFNCSGSADAQRAYRLLATREGLDDPVDFTKDFPDVLVNSKNIITPKFFYYGLSYWYYTDYLGLIKSQIGLLPVPMDPNTNSFSTSVGEAYKARPEFMLIPFEVNRMQTTDDYLQLITEVRGICDEFGMFGLPSYPMGYPFTYWEQFVFLERYLVIAVLVVLSATFIFSLCALMSFRAAFTIVFFLALNFFELYGFMGLLNIQLSAIPAITLIMSIGVALGFTVHVVVAFVNTPGDRNNRARGALEITLASTIDSTVSTIIVTTLLSNSQFDFVIKYFFHLLLCLVCTAAMNGIFVLPVVLSYFGPCSEVTNRAIGPSIQPALCIPISIHVSTPSEAPQNFVEIKKRELYPIEEASERSSTAASNIRRLSVEERKPMTADSSRSSQYSSRPSTPFFVTSTIESHDLSLDPSYIEENFLNSIPRRDNSAWNHVPKLFKRDVQLNRNKKYSNNTCAKSHDYRDLPNICRTNNRNTSTGKKTSRTNQSAFRNISNSRQTHKHSNNSNYNLPNNDRASPQTPHTRVINVQSRDDSNARVIHVQQSRDDSNVSKTTVKATISIEVETSHQYGSNGMTPVG